MRIVVALGGNALLQKGEALSSTNQRQNVRLAAKSLAPVVENHELVISHGNGPQVGLLALQASALSDVEPYTLDVLGAETEGMIGYMIEQELGNLLPFEQPFATILTMVEVDPNDPAFHNPTKPIGPHYTHEEARRLEAERKWTFADQKGSWRRVVPSPTPLRIFEIRPIRWLLEKGVIVICAGGGGIPTMYDDQGQLRGADVVVDKDRASGLLAAELDADLLILATDVDGVYENWGTPEARRIDEATPDELQSSDFSSGSMGPKVEAACAFVRRPGRRAVIGALTDVHRMVRGEAGTSVVHARPLEQGAGPS